MRSGLKLENFSCRAARGVDMVVAPGQCLGLTGPSGAGKTIFLRALADLDAYEGRMLLDGQAADSMPAPQWRRKVGLLPAESAWWADTVGDHFEQAPTDWLPRLGFTDQVLTWHVSHLSSGERQRLAFLRLLVNRPQVLLLDEPTANLDAENTARIEALIEEYRTTHRPGIVWVSHDMAQLQRWCHPILFIAGQRLAPLEHSLPHATFQPKAGEAL